MGGFRNSRSTRCSSGGGETGLNHSKYVISRKAIKLQVGVPGVSPIPRRAIGYYGKAAIQKQVNKKVTFLGNPLAFLQSFQLHDFCCCGHASTQGHGHRTGAEAALLPSAVDDRFNSMLQVPANVQCSDALWPINLVSRQAD